MSEVSIREIIRQASPYLNFTDSKSQKIFGSKLRIVEFRAPDMSKTTGGCVKIDWEKKDAIPLTPTSIDIVEYTNDTSENQSFQIDKEYKETKTFTWTLNQALTLGASKETPFAVDALAGKTTVSFEFKFEASQSWTTTKEETRRVSKPLIAPKFTHTTATWMMDQFDNALLPFTATYRLLGIISFVLLAFDGQYKWQGSAGELVAAAIKGGAQDWEVKEGNAFLSFGGTLIASQGTKTYIVMRSEKLKGATQADEPSDVIVKV